MSWKALEITFSNIGGVREPYTLRFTGGTKYLTGPSWAGKTSSIKAIKVGIFGGDPKKLKPLITKGEQEASIVVTIEKDGELIKIERKIGKIGRKWSHLVTLSRRVNNKWKTEFKDDESTSADPQVLKALDIEGKEPRSLFKDPLDRLYMELAGIDNYIRSLSPSISMEVIADCKKALSKSTELLPQKVLKLKELDNKEKALSDANLLLKEHEKLLIEEGIPTGSGELLDFESVLDLQEEMKKKEEMRVLAEHETKKLLSEIEAREAGIPLPTYEELDKKLGELIKEKEQNEKTKQAEIERIRENFDTKIKELELSRDEQIKKIETEYSKKIEDRQGQISDIEGKIAAQKATKPLEEIKAEKTSRESQIQVLENQINDTEGKLQGKLKKYPGVALEKLVANRDRISRFRNVAQRKDETEHLKQELCSELGIKKYSDQELKVTEKAQDWSSVLRDVFTELPQALDAEERARIIGLINIELRSLLKRLGSDVEVIVDEGYAMEARRVEKLDLNDLSLGERGVVGASIDISLGDQPTIFFDDAVMLDKKRCGEIGRELSKEGRLVVFTWRESTPFNQTFVIKPEQSVKEYLKSVKEAMKEDTRVKVVWDGNTFQASEDELKTCLRFMSKLSGFSDEDLTKRDVSASVGMVALGILISQSYIEVISDDGRQFKVLKKIDPAKILASFGAKNE